MMSGNSDVCHIYFDYSSFYSKYSKRFAIKRVIKRVIGSIFERKSEELYGQCFNESGTVMNRNL